ncbi:MAG: hypothetical protein AB9891_07195 [Anaerolineaceae bacterium]
MNEVNDVGFVSTRIIRTAAIHLNGSLAQVFPLFGALREKDWAAGWDPRVLYSKSGEIEEHMLFQTSSTHGHAEADFTWLVSKYRPDEYLVEYTVFTPERVWWIKVQCREGQSPMSTQANVTYTYNGLTERGNHLSQAAAGRMFTEDLRDWERAINYYLGTV